MDTLWFSVALGLLAFALGAWWQHNRLSRSLTSLKWYRASHLRKQGWSLGFGQYELQSLDGGKNWFSVISVGGGGIQATGPADLKLLDHLAAWDALTARVVRGGPLNLSHADDRKLLERAGLQAVSRECTS